MKRVKIKPSTFAFIGLSLSLSAFACDSDENLDALPAESEQALATYAQIVEASYEDSLRKAMDLDSAIAAFVAAPSEQGLVTARQAWLDAREPYLQTEVYRFYDGPIDNPVDGPEGMINAWPLDEAYIDYTEGMTGVPIIYDPNTPITAESLMMLNERGGDENIATGYHAIEFLLWGQDFNASGPGERPYTDYVESDAGPGMYAQRRKEYLLTVSKLLVTHLTGLVESWRPQVAGNYREQFAASTQKAQLQDVLTGMIVLSGFETGGERIQTALSSGDQEDEHSCFSDNTHRDMIQDIQGILNVWRGSYARTDGSSVMGLGIDAIVRAVDPALADQVDAQIVQSLADANALVPPFDQEIAIGNVEGRARLTALMNSLMQQEMLLQQVFQTFGLEAPVIE